MKSFFPVLEELNVGFVAFSPMANGFLTGKYGKGESLTKVRLQGFYAAVHR